MPLWFYSEGGAPITGAFAGSTSTTNAWSFAGLPFGTAAPDRYIVAIFGFGAANGITTMSIGGVPATPVLTATNSTERIYVFIAPVPLGTSGTVTTDGSGTGTMTLTTYAIYGSPNTTTTFTGTASISQSPSVGAGSFVIGAGLSISGVTTFTALTLDHTQTQGILALTTGSMQYAPGTIGVSVTGSTPVCAIAIFSP